MTIDGLLRRGACHRARIRATRWLLAMTANKTCIFGWDLAVSVGWVEPFAKPITVVENMMGIASLNPSYAS